MKIAVIGAGDVGGALGLRFAEVGHSVVYGVRNPTADAHRHLLRVANTSAAIVADAVAQADAVALSVPWGAVEQALADCGPLDGKILIDCTNPIREDFGGFAIGQTTSGAEEIARMRPEAKVVKCFNTTGFENMRDPVYEDGSSVMFAASDHDDAREIAVGLAGQIGFDPIALGSLAMARQLEQLAWLWIHIAVKEGRGTGFGFALIEREQKGTTA